MAFVQGGAWKVLEISAGCWETLPLNVGLFLKGLKG